MFKLSFVFFALFTLSISKLEAIEISSDTLKFNSMSRQWDIYKLTANCFELDGDNDLKPTEHNAVDDPDWELNSDGDIMPRIKFWELSDGEVILIE